MEKLVAEGRVIRDGPVVSFEPGDAQMTSKSVDSLFTEQEGNTVGSVTLPAKLTSKGQTTVPKQIRDALRVRPGDRLGAHQSGRVGSTH